MANKKVVNKKILILKKYLTIVLGAILMAISVNWVFEPMSLVTGGVSGLGIVIKRWTEPIIDGGFPIWLFSMLCNIPLFIASLVIKGKRFIISAITGTIVYILAMMVIPIIDLNF
jgi:uncharacterized membrane-anchored protein YitT (DUF2179 family)